ncbi:MAG: threonine synthase [Firmicutes bacterium]|nr:threonine synthase [Bacillota bacterium]
MQYNSTRNSDISISSAEAIKKGLADDGGLFVPKSFPEITISQIQKLADMSYRERAFEILSLFLTDFTKEELTDCINKAYTKEKFETDNIAPVYKLDDTSYILELWHGPTCAFKDMALQILPHLLTTSMKKTKENGEVVILVATSGDTGKAALEGFADVDGTRIIVFYPDNSVSEIQKLQMITQTGDNVCVSAVSGNFDDAQNGVKKIFTDEGYKNLLSGNNFKLSSANSINWGRLVPQIVYYFSAYCDMLAGDEIELGEKVNIVVPTGNFGNILAAYYAYKMGLPVNKFICASNKNSILTDFIKTGTYDRNRDFYTTISPSMDILISSNLERLLYDLSEGDVSCVKKWMRELSENGRYTVTEDVKNKISDLFYADFADDEETLAEIKDCYEKYGYVPDTHSAVALSVYKKYLSDKNDKSKTIIASTASPFKFNQSVLIALRGCAFVAGKDEFTLLEELNKISGMDIPKSLAELKTKIKIFDTVCDKDGMVQVVSDFLQIG